MLKAARLSAYWTALLLPWVVSPGALEGQYYRLVPTHRPSVVVELSKPFMGENYGRLTSVVDARVSVPLTERVALTGQVAAAYATAGRRSSSTTIANPAVGVTVEGPGLTEAELVVGFPLRSERGDDDYATDVAILSDPDRQERFTRGRWTVALTGVTRSILANQRVMGVRLGGLVLLPRPGGSTDLEVRYGVFLRARSRFLDFGGEFHGTARATGPASGFGERSSHTITVLISPFSVPGAPELLFHYPVDSAIHEYVRGTVGIRVTL